MAFSFAKECKKLGDFHLQIVKKRYKNNSWLLNQKTTSEEITMKRNYKRKFIKPGMMIT